MARVRERDAHGAILGSMVEIEMHARIATYLRRIQHTGFIV